MDGRLPVYAKALWALKVDKQHPDVRVHHEIAETLEHAVAIVARKRKRLRVQYPDKSRQAPLVGAIGPPLCVGRGEEEQRPALDERAILIGEGGSCQDLDQPVGELARGEPILQPPRAIVIHRYIFHMILRCGSMDNVRDVERLSSQRSRRNARPTPCCSYPACGTTA